MTDDFTPETTAPALLDEEKTIALAKPLKIAEGIMCEQLALREPTGAEWAQFNSKVGADRDVSAVSIVSGTPPNALKGLPASILIEASDYIASFLTPAPERGPADPLPAEFVVTLRKPIEAAGQTISQLDLREPTAGEWMEFEKEHDLAADFRAISLVSGIPLNAVRQIGARDLIVAGAYLAGFLERGHPAGAS